MAYNVLSAPQVHNTFGSLGVRRGDIYNVNDDCLRILEEILQKLANEDPTLRTFRRAIGFGQNIRKDLIPLLIHLKDDTSICDASKIIDVTIKILVNLTIPVECLLSIESVSRTDVGRHTIFELNRLLTTSKEAFADSRSTKAVMDHMKHVVEKDANLNVQQCDSINNCLLLLRNVLHIPETKTSSSSSFAQSGMQNEIIWNLFTQSIDKILIYLMSCPQKMYWGVTMVQLIALMYKDQHVGTLQKLLNLWLEATLSESSEDNESNTSPPDQGSGDCSPIITSDPTSDSSDNGVIVNNNNRNKNCSNTETRIKPNTTEIVRAVQTRSKAFSGMQRVNSMDTVLTRSSSGISSMGQSTDSCNSNSLKAQSSSSPHESAEENLPMPQQIIPQQTTIVNNTQKLKKSTKQLSPSKASDCGYATQTENQESISTSSNDDDQPHQKPVHQKPHTFQKTRYNNQKNRTVATLDHKELRRKKLVKRSKTNIINMKGLMHHQPTDEDISNILKEFTVDFLLKGYGTLVYNLHSQLLTNIHVPIDTSHFFWLVTYFLKFATQLELDLEHVSPVLSYDIISYLIFQGVWLYEELEVNSKIPAIDLKPCLRRLHLVVTAIREFLEAVETYRKLSHISDDDRTSLVCLQQKIGQTDDLKCLFLLLLRQYNPKLHSRQYLQDLIVTNHSYLLFLDNNIKKKNPTSTKIVEHLKQFATVEIMRQYGLLLEDFKENGEFVNNCVFTMMHHIGGDLENVSTLFQPSILKTFSQIWETDYEICDDWSDLIEYVIHKFINTPRTKHCSSITPPLVQAREETISTPDAVSSQCSENLNWTQEKEHLQNIYNQNKDTCDTIDNITKKFEYLGKQQQQNVAITKELLEQNVITQYEFDEFMKINNQMSKKIQNADELPHFLKQDTLVNGDVKVLKEFLYRENKGRLILWLQNVLLEACFAKLVLTNPDIILMDTNLIVEPSVFYYALLQLPIPVVPWTIKQCNTIKHQPFILLLHKLGFDLPVDTGKIFVTIPEYWNADYLFKIAQQLGPIDSTKLKFDVSLLEGCVKTTFQRETNEIMVTPAEKCKFSMTNIKETPSMIRYTPLPNSTEWIQTILQTKNNTAIDSTLPILSNHKLSIEIPEIELMPCGPTPPELNIVKQPRKRGILVRQSHVDMDISPTQEDARDLNDDIERNSAYETASVASDLTRMCVSDEEDKNL